MIDNVLALRPGESSAALVTVLASMLALSPSTARSPKAIKEITDGFKQKLTANVRYAENNDDRERGGHA
jgi:hypothetical protein